MNKKILFIALGIIFIILTNIISIFSTYTLTKSNCPINSVEPTQTPLVSPTANVSMEDTQITMTPTPEVLNLVSEGINGNTYEFFGYSMVVPNSYNIAVDLADGQSVILEPKIQVNDTHANWIKISSLAYPADFGIEAWEPAYDDEIILNGEKYTKLASVFAEGGESDGNVREYFEGYFNFHIFYDGLHIQEYVGGNAANVSVAPEYDPLKEIILNDTGAELLREMDSILATLQYN